MTPSLNSDLISIGANVLNDGINVNKNTATENVSNHSDMVDIKKVPLKPS